MSEHYPLEFSLEDGKLVSVSRTGNTTYEFMMTSKEGVNNYFTLEDDDRSNEAKTAHLNFDQLNAVRTFWLKKHDIV